MTTSEKIHTNKLSVYLIKSGYIQHGDILKNFEELKQKEIQNVGMFYYGESYTYKPSWIKNFFGEALDEVHTLHNASSKAILLVEIAEAGNNRIFAIPFGYGWQFLKQGVHEERFGLKTALSIIDADHLRKIDKKNMSVAPKDTREQLSKSGIAADFGIDIEQDLICSITGKSKDKENFGKTITGKDSLSVSVKTNLSSIKNFLTICLQRYLSDEYKKDFGWIDQMAEVKDLNLSTELNNNLIGNLRNNNFGKTWMAVPEIVEWEHVSGFKYKQSDIELKDDICIEDFLSALTGGEKINLNYDFLKNRSVYCFNASDNQIRHSWNAYNCIYCEVEDKKGKTFLLNNGKWYEIEKDFADEVNADFCVLRRAGSLISLPDYQHDNEAKYNEAISENDKNLYCMDRKLINHGGGCGKLEFCDLFSRDKKIIHVKRYGGSSVLSHLFSQGLVSGELFLGDKKFRAKVNEKLGDGFKIQDISQRPTPSEYEIVFGIISSSPHDLHIPFFSKVSLRNAKRKLETFGYKVSLLKISANNQHNI